MANKKEGEDVIFSYSEHLHGIVQTQPFFLSIGVNIRLKSSDYELFHIAWNS